jgi:hypothetical protein
MNEFIQNNMKKTMNLRREVRIIVNQRDNAIHLKTCDLIDIELEISMISKLVKERFNELVIQRKLLQREIEVLEDMYYRILVSKQKEIESLDGEFIQLIENLKGQ